MSTTTKPRPTVYDPEFKKQAVHLALTSGRPLAQVARELGLPPWRLRDWKQQLQPQLAQQPQTVVELRRRVAELHPTLGNLQKGALLQTHLRIQRPCQS